jgi:two-component system, sensor histidine kinase and response regulator
MITNTTKIRNQKILLVEDDERQRSTIAKILQFEGYIVLTAANAEEALPMCERHLPAMVITDLMMPERDGCVLIQHLQSQPGTARIPVIVISADSEYTSIRRAMRVGANDYLIKPLDTKELLETVRSHLHKNEHLRAMAEEQLTTLQRNLSTMLPHELRTPLSLILGASGMLADHIGDMDQESIVEIVRDIYESAQRFHRLVENCLLYNQLLVIVNDSSSSGKENYQLHLAETPDIIVRELVRNHPESERIAMNIVSPLPSLNIDPSYLCSAINELLSNALKFSPDTSTVHIASHYRDSTVEFVVFSQSNQMTVLQRASHTAFMQFRREIQEQQGIGLGLAIVKLICTLYGGRLEIFSMELDDHDKHERTSDSNGNNSGNVNSNSNSHGVSVLFAIPIAVTRN